MGGGGVDFLNPLHTFFKLESNFNFYNDKYFELY